MYLEIDEGFFCHRKALRLCGALRNPEGGMFAVRLWLWALRGASDGSLAGMESTDIEAAVQYQPGDGKCYAALVGAGFIEEASVGKPFCVSGWESQDGPIRLRVSPGTNRAAYGPNWTEIRAAILMRDGFRCTTLGCGAMDGLDVHHMRPLRLFDGDHEAANAPGNLTSLCRPCHGRADADFRRSERAQQTEATQGAS